MAGRLGSPALATPIPGGPACPKWWMRDSFCGPAVGLRPPREHTAPLFPTGPAPLGTWGSCTGVPSSGHWGAPASLGREDRVRVPSGEGTAKSDRCAGRGQRPVLADPPGQSHSRPPDPHGTPRKALDSYGASFGPDVPCWGRRPRELGRMLEELERGGGAGPSTVSAGPTGSGSPAAPPPRCVNRTRGYSVTGHAPAGGLLPVCLLNTDCC